MDDEKTVAGECVSCGTDTYRLEHGELTSYHLCHACYSQAMADLGQRPRLADPRFAALGDALAEALVAEEAPPAAGGGQ